MKRKILIFVLSLFTLSGISQDTLTLEEAIRIGLENNFSIIIQQNNAEIARNNNTIGNAGFLPTLTLNASQNNNINTTYQKYFSGDEKDIKNAQDRTFNAGIALSWTLFDGFSMFVSRDMLQVMEQMGETESRIVVENTVADIINGYYAILQQGKMVMVQRDAVSLSLERQKVAKVKQELGSASRLTWLQSTVDLNADSAMLIQEQAAIAQARADLNRLLGREASVQFEVTGEIISGSFLDYQEVLAAAATQNPDLLVARSNRELAALNLKDIRSDRYPTLNLQAGYSYGQLSSQTGFLSQRKAHGASYGLTLSYNLFNGFNTNREIKNARIDLETADYHFRDVDLGVRSEIYKAYQDYAYSLELVRLETTNQEVAHENVTVALEKYKLGALTDIELRETQKKFIDAQYQLLVAQFHVKQAETELRRLSGTLTY